VYRFGFNLEFLMAVSASGLSASSVSSFSATQGERVSVALRKPVEALSRQTESTRVRLSAFGQVQSAAAEVQFAARNLQDARQTSTVTDARKAAETFVKAYNNERSTLAQATNAGNSTNAPGVLVDDGRARIAASQLQRTVTDNAGAFRDAGITVQKNGSLSIDARAFEAAFNTNPSAVTQALGSVGRAAEATAARQLSSTGSLGASVNSLSNRVQELENRQAEVQTRTDQSQRNVEAASRRYGFGASGTGSYLGIFGL
jgi:flagellar capping protein FliD